MILPHITTLRWAFQLHYYVCFQTHRRRLFSMSSLDELITEICNGHGYHLLECETRPDHVRTVLSLAPAQSVAKIIQTIKTNSSRELPMTKPVWARGYLARSVGRTRIDVVKQYLDQQSTHHGYDSRVLPPVYRYRATHPRELRSAHSNFDLSHHLVFATCKRKGIFTSQLGEALTAYWLKVAAAHEFAIDQVSIVPDHVHLIARILPEISIEECALSLLNNGQHFIAKHHPQVFVQCGLDQLWEASAYAGTCGRFTTALIKSWLRDSQARESCWILSVNWLPRSVFAAGRSDLNYPPTAVGWYSKKVIQALSVGWTLTIHPLPWVVLIMSDRVEFISLFAQRCPHQ